METPGNFSSHVIQVNSQKHLASFLDWQLDFNKDLSNISDNVIGLLRKLQRIYHLDPLIYKSFIKPILDCRDIIYDQQYSASFLCNILQHWQSREKTIKNWTLLGRDGNNKNFVAFRYNAKSFAITLLFFFLLFFLPVTVFGRTDNFFNKRFLIRYPESVWPRVWLFHGTH